MSCKFGPNTHSECTSSNAYRLLHEPDAEWVLLDESDLDWESTYVDMLIVSVNIHPTSALLLEWGSVEEFVNDVCRDCESGDARGKDQEQEGGGSNDDAMD